MNYYFFAAVVLIITFPVILLIEKLKTVYEVKLFIHNNCGEFLLVYDQRTNRFTVPYRQVSFDEIPTKVVHSIMNDMSVDSDWDFDYQYHFADHKFDRSRDDTGPSYIYDVSNHIGRKCVLCYIICLNSQPNDYAFKKEYPFPEFYTLYEIGRMSADIKPSAEVLKILKNYFNNTEASNEHTQKSS